MTKLARIVKVNEMKDAVIARDGAEADGTIAVCSFIEHMDRTCGFMGDGEIQNVWVGMMEEVVAEYSEGGAL